MKGTGTRYSRPNPVERTETIKLVKGSKQQEAIWAYLGEGKGHIVVHALAGTGKTFSLLQGLARQDLKSKRAIYLAFNSAIKDEMLSKSPSSLMVKTMNAYGLSVVASNGHKGIQSTRDKYSNLFNELCPPQSEKEMMGQGQCARHCAKLIALAQSYMLVKVTGKKANVDKKDLLALAEKHDVCFQNQFDEERVYNAVSPVLSKGMNIFNVLSFEDQLWMPIVHNMQFDRFDIVAVDEAQDLNAVQHELVARASQHGRAIVVGDENQAIYGFRGADSDSINTLSKKLETTGKEVKHFDLTMTRRCGKEIVKYCQQWVPTFEAYESNKEGMVIRTDNTTAENDDLWQPGTMTVCRMNAPLVRLAYRLIGKDKKVHFIGRDFGNSIIGLVKGLNPKSIDDLLVRLEAYRTKEMTKLEAQKASGRDVENEIENLEDRTSVILVFAGKLEEKGTVTELISNMESFFRVKQEENGNSKDAKESVRLSTIHRAKGLEADTVFWLFPEIAIRTKSEWQIRQEANLCYVAASRAINTLFLVSEDKETSKSDHRDSKIMAKPALKKLPAAFDDDNYIED